MPDFLLLTLSGAEDYKIKYYGIKFKCTCLCETIFYFMRTAIFIW